MMSYSMYKIVYTSAETSKEISVKMRELLVRNANYKKRTAR